MTILRGFKVDCLDVNLTPTNSRIKLCNWYLFLMNLKSQPPDLKPTPPEKICRNGKWSWTIGSIWPASSLETLLILLDSPASTVLMMVWNSNLFQVLSGGKVLLEWKEGLGGAGSCFSQWWHWQLPTFSTEEVSSRQKSFRRLPPHLHGKSREDKSSLNRFRDEDSLEFWGNIPIIMQLTGTISKLLTASDISQPFLFLSLS